jgi:hypothetical protein
MYTVRGDMLSQGYAIDITVNQLDTDSVHLQGVVILVWSWNF